MSGTADIGLAHWVGAFAIAAAAHGVLLGAAIPGPTQAPESTEVLLDLDLIGDGAHAAQITHAPTPELEPALDATLPPDAEASHDEAAQATPTASHPEQTNRQRREAPRRVAAAMPATPPAKRGTRQSGTEATRAAQAIDLYFAELQTWLTRHKTYPASARSAGIEGVVNVEFEISRTGNVQWARVLRSSGWAELDTAAFALIEQANPMPPIPQEIDSEVLTLTVPLQYRVH